MSMTKTKEVAAVTADLETAEAALIATAKEAAPMLQRQSTHRDRIELAVKELESERFEMISRRDSARRLAEGIDAGFTQHIDDIEATIRLYEQGMQAGGPGADQQG
jgi:hypothetical protein